MNTTITERIRVIPCTIPERWDNRYSETEEYAYRMGHSDTRKAAASLVEPLEASHGEALEILRQLAIWDQANPKGKIYPIGPNDVERQLDAIVDRAKTFVANAEKLNTKQ